MLLLVLVALVLELVMLVLVMLVLVSAQPPARVMVILVRDVSFSILFEAPKLLRHSNAHIDCELD